MSDEKFGILRLAALLAVTAAPADACPCVSEGAYFLPTGKIDCAEFQHSHEIAKLIGSPPGYLGHRETSPMFTQAALSKWHTARAMRGKKQTISADFIVPLRREIARLRGLMLARMPR